MSVTLHGRYHDGTRVDVVLTDKGWSDLYQGFVTELTWGAITLLSVYTRPLGKADPGSAQHRLAWDGKQMMEHHGIDIMTGSYTDEFGRHEDPWFGTTGRCPTCGKPQ